MVVRLLQEYRYDERYIVARLTEAQREARVPESIPFSYFSVAVCTH